MKEVQEMLQKELKKFKKCYHYALESEKDQENEKYKRGFVAGFLIYFMKDIFKF